MKKGNNHFSILISLLMMLSAVFSVAYAEENFDASIVSAYWINQTTAEITFDKDITLGGDIKNKVQYDGPSFIKRNLGDNDSITTEGKTVRVTVKGSRVGDNIYFEPGALIAEGAANSETVTATAVLQKVITKAEYSPTEFNSAGGKLSISVSGKNLYTSNEWLVANVYQDGELFKTIEPNENEYTLSVNLPENTGIADKVYTVKYKSSRWDYNAKDIEVQEGSDAKIIVKGRVTAADPVINSISYSVISLSPAGGEVVVTLKGEALTQLTSGDFVLKSGGKALDGSAVSLEYKALSDSEATVTFTLPANASETYEEIYSFELKKGADSLDNREQEIIVRSKGKVYIDSVKYDLSSASISNRSTMYSIGGNLDVKLEGDNLAKITRNNFKIEIDDEDVTDFGFQVIASEDNLAKVRFDLPANELEQKRKYKITTLAADEGVVNRVWTYTIDASPQDKSDKFAIPVDEWDASLVGKGSIKISINKTETWDSESKKWIIDQETRKIDLRVSPDEYKHNADFIKEIKEYIFFAASQPNTDGTYDDVRYLTDKDELRIEDNNIYISLADKDSKIPNFIIFRTGSLKATDGKETRILGNDEFTKDHFRTVSQSPHIESMSFNKITFDSKGGEAIVNVKGNMLDESSPNMWAKVLIDTEKEPSKDIEPTVDVKSSTEAIIKFNLPANNTGKTISYRLIPVINNTSVIQQYIKGYDVISVLPAGARDTDITLSSIEIQGAYDLDENLDVFKTSTSAEQFTSKVDVVIRGTNLSGKKTLIKAIDENGIEWPMLPVYECGATIRWQNSAYYLPEKPMKNEQHIELLLPRRLGITRTFKILVAPDGKNYLESPYGTVIIENNGIFDHSDMALRGFTEDDLTKLTSFDVLYVDESGKELAPKDTYPGYGITELYHLGIKAKDIPGYEVVKKDPLNLDSMLMQPVQHSSGEFEFVEGQYFIASLKGNPIRFIYKKSETKEDSPSKTDEPTPKNETKADGTTPNKSADVTKTTADTTASDAGKTTTDETKKSDSVGKNKTEAATKATAPTAAETDKMLKGLKSDKDPSGAKIAPLMLRSSGQTKNTITLKWKGVSGAKKYVIYGNACGKKNKLKKLASVKKKKTYKVKKINKKLKKGTYHKFIVVALDKNNNVVSVSKLIHVATSGGKVGNYKSISTKAKKNKVGLKKGKTFKLKARAIPKSKKLKVKYHGALRYESSNVKIATVSKKGVVKAKGKGTCKIYVYAQDGVSKTIKVTVK